MNRTSLTFLAAAWLAFGGFSAFGASSLVINEIQVTNIDQYIDPSFNYGGWIELYNPTNAEINLANMVVSDHLGRSFTCPTNMGSVPAKGFKNLWFDHNSRDNKYSSQAFKQVSFKLQYEGGEITLCDAEGNVLDSQSYPPAVQRASYARTTDGGSTWSMTGEPTPEASNNGSTFASVQLAMPVIDKDACVYTDPFTVRVTIPQGATLRYTTDGSTPTATTGKVSKDGVFNVGGNTQIFRFRLFKDGYLPSSVATRTYVYRDKNYYLPIVSVVTDDKNLFDNRIGAYVDGTNGTSGNNKSSSNKNRAWERPVNFEYLVPDEADGGSFRMALNQECDFEVCGGWSRHFAPDGSFRLKGGKYYLDQNFLPYPFFSEKPYIKNKTIVVRNGGNDNYGRIKDAGIHEVMLRSGFYIDCQSVQPAHIFINGQYKFMFNLREPNNKNHAYANYGIDTDELDQFEINGSKGYEQKTGNDVAFRQWMSLATQLAANPTNELLYQQICEMVDIDEYANYMAMECYSGCSDWLTNCNNAKGYRAQADGKFHLIVMDQDQGFSTTSMLSSLSGRLNDSRYDTGRSFLIDIFLNMLKNATFKKRFIDAFCIVNGSVFDPDLVRATFNDMVERAAPAMAMEGHESNMRSSASSMVNTITSSNNRSSRINNMRSYFGLSNGYNINLSSDIADAGLLLNGQPIPTGKFNGTVFAPAKITAKAPAGYRFRGWMTDGVTSVSDPVFGTDAQWNYYDQGSLDGEDWKSASYDASAWQSGRAPLGYGNIGINGSADYATTLDYGENSNQKRPTYYFRKVLHLDKAPKKDEIYQLTFYVDDGFVAYINGTEVGRYLMRDGETHYNDYSTTYAGSQAGSGVLTIDNSILRAGDNIIAVEVHNTSATSTDIYWTCEVSRLSKSDASYFSTSEELDITSLGSAASYTLVASFEELPEEDLLANMASPIKVNEVGASNSVFINEFFKKNDWIELYNTTDVPMDAAGLFISDDLEDPLKYQIPSGTINTIIPAHGHLVVWADKLDPVTQLHAPFKLGNNDGERVLVTASETFVNNNADYFNAHPTLKGFADCLTYNTHNGDQSVGRYPDGAHSFYQMTRPTIAWQNHLHSYDTYLGEEENIMNVDDEGTDFALNLMEGWNWMSHPMADAIPVNDFREYANQVRGRSLDAQYNSSSQAMEGSLKTLEPATLYKMEMDEEHTYNYHGRLMSSVPMPLQTGWNWMGYPATGLQTITNAFSGTMPDAGDIVMGQGGFSVYDAGRGWVGTLSTLVPGQGYMYKSVRAKNISFMPAASQARLTRSRQRSAKEVQYGFDKYAYPDVMGIVATLRLDGQTVDANQFTVQAYVGGQCRGVGEAVGDVLMLTAYGVDGEHLTFRATDAEGENYKITATVDFASDVSGTLTAPVVFELNDVGTVLPEMASASATPVGFYTLGGMYAGKQSRTLTPGIYVVRFSDGSRRKVVVKK